MQQNNSMCGSITKLLLLPQLYSNINSKVPKMTSEEPLKLLLSWPLDLARLFSRVLKHGSLHQDVLYQTLLHFLRQSCIHFLYYFIFCMWHHIWQHSGSVQYYYVFHLQLTVASRHWFEFQPLVFSVFHLHVLPKSVLGSSRVLLFSHSKHMLFQ